MLCRFIDSTRPSGYEGCWKSANGFIDWFSALSAREILLFSPLFPLNFSCSGSENGSALHKSTICADKKNRCNALADELMKECKKSTKKELKKQHRK